MAWQLPNSYRVALAHRPKGRQKRINQMLSDLFMKGMTGNAQQVIEKRYFGDAARAVRTGSAARLDRLKMIYIGSKRGTAVSVCGISSPVKN
ncbi:MAG: hypothetical protein M5U34_16855 [Chloroflexi bacterium]|nr:hypothetical protein [Chloroflexota bacterium]